MECKGCRKVFGRVVNGLVNFILCVFGLFIFVTLLWLFVFDFYRIPTSSMEPTIIPGDWVLVNKMSYGARFYSDFDFLDGVTEPQTWRMPGCSDVERNDIVVFNFPYDVSNDTLRMSLSKVYIKRCIATAGDTVSIDNGYYIVNGEQGLGSMSKQAELAAMDEAWEGIRYTLPFDSKFSWDAKNFGPLLVPKIGDTILLNRDNYLLYRKMIQYECSKEVTMAGGQIKIGEEQFAEYTFTKNWYFMVGDNVLNSIDGRHWGAVPEEFIIGKAVMLLYSEDEKAKLRDTRFF